MEEEIFQIIPKNNGGGGGSSNIFTRNIGLADWQTLSDASSSYNGYKYVDVSHGMGTTVISGNLYEDNENSLLMMTITNLNQVRVYNSKPIVAKLVLVG